MRKFIHRLAPIVYVYSALASLIVTGAVLFVSVSEFSSGRLQEKVHLYEGQEREEYTNTRIRSNNAVFRGDYPPLEGGLNTEYDGKAGSTPTLHVPIGEEGYTFYEQDIYSDNYAPFTYSGDYAKEDDEERYLLVYKNKRGYIATVSVSKEQYDSVSIGEYLVIRGDGIKVSKGGE